MKKNKKMVSAKCLTCWDLQQGHCEGLSCDPGGCWTPPPEITDAARLEIDELAGEGKLQEVSA